MSWDHLAMTAEEGFERVVEALAGEPGVTPPGAWGGRGFGAEALKVHGSIFAMLAYGQLVVKLPAARVRALLGDGTGQPFHAGKRAPMRQWVAVGVDRLGQWEELAAEALRFVGDSAP